jgi:hypothetical protein
MKTRTLLAVAALAWTTAAGSGMLLASREAPAGGLGGDPLEILALGGFRPIAIDLVQARADLDLKRGRHFAVLADLDLLMRLQPRNDGLWAFYLYHLAFNLPPLETTEEAQRKWVLLAVDYGKKALQRFPASSIVHARFGFVCAVGVRRDPVLAEEFTRSQGRSPLAAAVESFDRAARLAPSAKLFWQWGILCRRDMAREELWAERFAEARIQFEAIREEYGQLLARFHTHDAILARGEPQNASEWIAVSRLLELEGRASAEARARLREMETAYPWEADFVSEFRAHLEER